MKKTKTSANRRAGLTASQEQVVTTYGSSYPLLRISLLRRNARLFMAVSLAVADFIGLFLASAIALWLRFALMGKLIPSLYLELIPLSSIIIIIYLLAGLYRHGLGAVEELQRLTTATSVVFLSLATLSFWMHTSELFSRGSFILAWLFALVFIPTSRNVLRAVAIRLKVWGEPVVVIGYGPLGSEIARFLIAHPEAGLLPLVAIDRRRVDRQAPPPVPVVRADDILENPQLVDWFEGIQTAILVVPETSELFHTMIVEEQQFRFNRLLIVSSAQQTSSLWVRPYDIGGILGLEVGQNLASLWQNGFKRLVDLGLIVLASPFLALLFALIALLIRLGSKGAIFYRQLRIGQGGNEVNIWKFCTMYPDAEKLLKTYLEQNPPMRAEWEATFKLKNDPRITRMGKILRKFSLDELPQLINVLKGEMSLVGPRPIVEREINLYAKCFRLYRHVLPGMTGLWQVSGRNELSYQSRVALDEYYVRNWSIWLDIHILTRTLWVVLRSRGSY
jgi:Undecaprenyl-phosphate galactose phosphotransferase WbaP